MKKLTLAIAMAALVIFAGCKKEQETAGTTLKASIEQQKGDDNRTSLNPTNGAINWTSGDKILVYNGTSTATFRLTAGAGGTNGTFTYNGEYEITDNIMAVYPETCVITDTGVTFTLPDEQTLAAPGTFANGANPMLGINTSNGLTFVSICGGLGLSLTGDNVDITAIEIVSEGEMLTGTYTGYFNNDNIDVTNGKNSVRLNCTTTLTADAQEFYIVLPVGVLGNGFTLNIYNGSVDPIFTKTTTTDLTVELNKVKKMNTLEVTLHEYVDLGLPSGLLWATCNIGANAPEEYGDYFAWGETTPKSVYDWDNYQFWDGNNLTKYNESDGLTTLLPEDDAAVANWGNGWRIPTLAEWQELIVNTTGIRTQLNGESGYLFTASNGNTLFIPAAGDLWDPSGENYDAGWGSVYWSSSLFDQWTSYSTRFVEDDIGMTFWSRTTGLPVRPVREN